MSYFALFYEFHCRIIMFSFGINITYNNIFLFQVSHQEVEVDAAEQEAVVVAEAEAALEHPVEEQEGE